MKFSGYTNKSNGILSYAVEQDGDEMNLHFNKQAADIMKDAQLQAKEMGNNYIGSEHLLLAIIQDTTTAFSKLLAKQCVFYFQLKEDLMVLFGLQDKEVENIQITQVVEDIVKRSIAIAHENKQKLVDVDTLSVALLQTPSCVATEILNRYDINVNEVLGELYHGSTNELDKVHELRNLNKALNNRDIVGREHELDLMISILSRKDKANPLLIGEPGVGKTALVEKLAAMIEDKQVPKDLEDAVIYELHLNTLVAGTKYRGDFEEKLQNLINLLQKYPNVILFVDEIHQMIGAGKSEGSIDVSSVLKPYLARGVIRCIGATTNDEYEKYMEQDRALERRFQIVMIKEPNREKTIAMLQAKRCEYEAYHNVVIDPLVIDKIVDYSAYFMPQRKFPDKAIDVLDLACVGAKRIHREDVDETLVKMVIEQMTDIPLLSENRLEKVKQSLSQQLLGQKQVIKQIVQQLAWIEKGIIANRPLGVWLFLGNAGNGKTTCIREFSKAYFNDDDVLDLDMSTFDLHIKTILSKLRRNPYRVLSISNIHTANASQLLFLKQGIAQGSLEYEEKHIDLRHSIIIMSGEFKLHEGSLRFQEKNSWIHEAEKSLGEDFMKVFDDIMIFEELPLSIKKQIIIQQLSSWNSEMAESDVEEVLRKTENINDVYRCIRSKNIHA